MIVHHNFLCLIVILVIRESKTDERITIKPNILGPAKPNRPFVVGWNVASEHCGQEFGVPLNLSDFDIIHNPDFKWQGSSLTIFYHKQLGLLPWLDPDGTPVNGGLPQLVDLDAHLEKAAKDIEFMIPNPDFNGPAVIDWECWRPLFDRMTSGRFVMYRNMSIDKVKAKHPDWPKDMIFEKAKFEYEAGAKTLISFTLALAKLMRPKALWGYYLYPDCYNYDKYNNKTDDRKCKNSTLHMNDEIQWMYDESTALFPSCYIGEWLHHNKTVIPYVAYRIQEAMRVDHNRPGRVSIPVVMYHSITYRKVTDLVELFDLRDSIGIAAMLGASGTVIWGDHKIANSKESCIILSKYISNTFGPYVKATSDYAAQCSDKYCSGHGRCVFSPIPSNEYNDEKNYLSVPEALNIVHQFRKTAYRAFESPQSSYTISCQCYNEWSGKDCHFN